MSQGYPFRIPHLTPQFGEGCSYTPDKEGHVNIPIGAAWHWQMDQECRSIWSSNGGESIPVYVTLVTKAGWRKKIIAYAHYHFGSEINGRYEPPRWELRMGGAWYPGLNH